MGIWLIISFACMFIHSFTGVSSYTLVTRSEWGASSPTGQSMLTTPVGKVYLRQTTGSSCTTQVSCETRVKSLQDYYMNDLGWWDIPYNFLVGGDGKVYEGRGWDTVGAHTSGQNSVSIGIAFIGTFSSSSPPTSAAQTAALELIADGKCKNKVTSDPETPTSTQPVSLSWFSTPDIVSRAGWGARSATAQTSLTTPVSKVYIHHTVTSSCSSQSTCSSRVRSIQNYHMDHNGWDDIGYSFLVGGDGKVYTGRGWDNQGAHTGGQNSVSIGIAFIGDFTSSLPTADAQAAAKSLIADGVREGEIGVCYTLYGHRDVSSTLCPGTALYNLIEDWNNFA